MRSTRKIAAGISAAMFFAAVGVVGCGDDDNSGDSGGDKAAKIAYITYVYADYQQAQEAGLKKAIGEDGTVQVLNANFDPQKQQQQCTDAITSGRFNAIVLAAVTPPTGVPCVTAAKAAGIPVVAIELPVGESSDEVKPQVDGVVGSAVTPLTPGGTLMADLVTSACEGKDPCNVILDTIPGDPFGTVITDAVKGVAGVKIVQKINTNYDPAQMAKVAPDMFAKNPDADVVVTLSDAQALAAIPAAKAAGVADSVKLIGTGGSRLGAKAVANGTMFGSLGTWPFQTGEAAGKMALQAVNGQTVDPETVDALTIDKPATITPETVDEFTPEWGATTGS